MPQASPEEVGRELSDLAFGIVEQNWLEQHIGWQALDPTRPKHRHGSGSPAP